MTIVKGTGVGYLEKVLLELEHEIAALEAELATQREAGATLTVGILARTILARRQFRADVLEFAQVTATRRLQMLVEGPRLTVDMAEWNSQLDDAERWAQAYKSAATYALAELSPPPRWKTEGTGKC